MSTQIAIRLPEDLVEFIDALVARGDEPSRATIVIRALQRERRRIRAQQDVEILKATADYPGFDAMAAHASRQPMDLD